MTTLSVLLGNAMQSFKAMLHAWKRSSESVVARIAWVVPRDAVLVGVGVAAGFGGAAALAYIVESDNISARVSLNETREHVLRAIAGTAGGVMKRWNRWRAVGGEGRPFRGFIIDDERNKMALSRTSPLAPMTRTRERYQAAVAAAAAAGSFTTPEDAISAGMDADNRLLPDHWLLAFGDADAISLIEGSDDETDDVASEAARRAVIAALDTHGIAAASAAAAAASDHVASWTPLPAAAPAAAAQKQPDASARPGLSMVTHRQWAQSLAVMAASAKAEAAALEDFLDSEGRLRVPETLPPLLPPGVAIAAAAAAGEGSSISSGRDDVAVSAAGRRGLVSRVVEVMSLEQVRVAALHLDEAMRRPQTAAVPLGLHRLRPGDHLAYTFMRAPGLEAWHHAVFLGEDPPRLIEVTGNGIITAVAITSLQSFLECAAEFRSPLLRVEYEVPQPRLLILRRALWALGRWPFNMLTENCEHVSTWASQGVLISPQTSRLPLGEAQPARPVQPPQRADDEAAVTAFLGGIVGAQTALQERLRSTRQAAAATVESAGRAVQRSTRATVESAGRQLNALQARVTLAATAVLRPGDGEAKRSQQAEHPAPGKQTGSESGTRQTENVSIQPGPWRNLSRWLVKQQQHIRGLPQQQHPIDAAAAAGTPDGERGLLGLPKAGTGPELELELFGFAFRQPSRRGCVCRATGCRHTPALFGGGTHCLIEAGCRREDHNHADTPDDDSGEAAGGWSVNSWKAATAQLDRMASEIVDSCDRDEVPRRAAVDPSTEVWGFLPNDDDEASDDGQAARDADACTSDSGARR